MDEWLKWWESEGSRSFSNQHPEVTALVGKIDPENGLEAPRQVPINVLALGFEPGREYTISRVEALELAKGGQFRLRVFDTDAIGRFLDPVLEKGWAAGHEKAGGQNLLPKR